MALVNIRNYATLTSIDGDVKINRYRAGVPLEITFDQLEDYIKNDNTSVILDDDTFLMAPHSAGKTKHREASYLKTYMLLAAGAKPTDLLLVSVGATFYKLTALGLRSYYFPITVLSLVSSGLLRKDNFSTYTGWSGDTGSFNIENNAAVVPFAPFRNYDFAPSGDPDEAYGARQGTPYIELGVHYLLYDGGPAQSVADWAINKATSIDRGKTWSRVFDFGPAYDNGLGGTWPATACGFVAKFGSTYYLYRVVLTTSPGGLPYYGDIWSATSLTGSWTYEDEIPRTPATFTSDECLPGSIIKVGSTYHLIIQGRGSTGLYKIGRMSSSTPVGPWTLDTTIISDTLFTTDIPENPKVFYSTALSKYVMLVNTFSDLGAGYRSRCTYAFYSSSITDWSAKTIKKIQRECLLDGTPAIGVMTHVTGPDGAVIVGDNGFIPAYYDSEGTINSSGGTDQAWGRKIRGVCLEPSLSVLKYTGGVLGVGKWIMRALSHTDFVAEFGVEFPDAVIDKNIGFWYRADSAPNNGYLLISRCGQDTVLYKNVAGSYSVIGGNNLLTVPEANMVHRIKIAVSGTSHKVWFDGELQIDITDSAHSSGTYYGHYAFDAVNCFQRLFHMRLSDVVTVNGLSVGANVTLRSDGKLPVISEDADGSGVATLTWGHYPQETLDVDLYDTTPINGIYGGDTYET